MNKARTQGRSLLGMAFLLFAVFGLVLLFGWWRLHKQDAVVVYCAHDAVYAEEILNAFSEKFHIRVIPVFDTEATKSLGLTELIRSERNHPRCDVFWNNEILGTLALQQEGLLAAYPGPGWERMPEAVKDSQARWTGFAARLRVLLVNTNLTRLTALDPWPAVDPSESPQTGWAMPLYGTTLTHYSVLAHAGGIETLQARHQQAVQAGLKFLPGNAAVKDAVARGQLSRGFTDTDDAMQAVVQGAPVQMFPVHVDGKSIVIPNTVSMIEGCKHPKLAQQLIDFLLSEETETALANSPAQQIPLGPTDLGNLPPQVKLFVEWASAPYPLEQLLPMRDALIPWLKEQP